MKNTIGIILMATLMVGSLTAVASCSSGDGYSKETNIIEDNYRNYYEIFPVSYRDSDGDRVGDLNGITEKLDYIKDLGYNGLWLTPVHPSPSYHKYDVMDYKTIDSSLGTLSDYENLLNEAHKRNIKVIMDFVVNHTSTQHPWFKACKEAYANGTESKYKDYYNVRIGQATGYTGILTGNYWYEESFTGGTMADLNLENEDVKADIVDIMKFWLNKGVDGFRLDAVKYLLGETNKNIEFLSWLNSECKKIKEDAYIIGEDYETGTTIASYYTSGIDSFFYFPLATIGGGGGLLNECLLYKDQDSFETAINRLNQCAGEYIPAPFIGNHDLARVAGVVGRDKDKVKFVQGLLSMMNGSMFTYYGDEIGMIGNGTDPNKRLPMKWNKSVNAKGTTFDQGGADVLSYEFPSVSEQLGQSSSIINYYKKSLLLRNQNPEIARGTCTFIENDNDNVVLMKKEYKNNSILIVINLSDTQEATIDLCDLEYQTISNTLCVEGKVKLSDNKLEAPRYSITILKK